MGKNGDQDGKDDQDTDCKMDENPVNSSCSAERRNFAWRMRSSSKDEKQTDNSGQYQTTALPKTCSEERRFGRMRFSHGSMKTRR